VEDVLLIGICFQAGFWGLGLVAYGIERLIKGKSADDPARTMGVTVLKFLGTTLVWSIVVLSCLQALGAPVGTLIASLGVGGIAVALALQNVLGDLFASITILLDKPFIVGDGIQVGDFVGNIERIGVKTTRLRSVNGEEIVMGNHDLVSSRIRNFKRLNERRIVLALAIEYGTPVDLIERIPKILEDIVAHIPETRFDRAHFKGFGDSALQFEAVYFSLRSEYLALMDVQQAVNIAILRRFDEEGIAFAFPTQTVRHVLRDGESVPGLDPQLQTVAAHEMTKQMKKPN
jgi:small-conductance mechanosensitive channel